jgi:hypothetical protein
MFYTLQALNAKKIKINNKEQNMGQIVKTWVKVLGLNDPYRSYME